MSQPQALPTIPPPQDSSGEHRRRIPTTGKKFPHNHPFSGVLLNGALKAAVDVLHLQLAVLVAVAFIRKALNLRLRLEDFQRNQGIDLLASSSRVGIVVRS